MAQADPGRRAFLARAAGAVGAFIAATLGVPLVGATVAPTARREEVHWTALGAEADFPIGSPHLVTFGSTKIDGYVQTTLPRSVWVYRPSPGSIIIYNARCTHLGCLISHRANSRTFACPCHGGIFAQEDGAVLEGPPPRPLDRLDHRIDENGQLQVLYRDFLVGVPNQVAL